MKRQTVPSEMIVTQAGSTRVSSWRAKAIAVGRIAFGCVWAIAAWLKWQPGFLTSTFTQQVSSAKSGQPPLLHAWISFWATVVSSHPHLFAYIPPITETLLAVCLISGLLTNFACVVGIVYSLGIWSTAEGFGGPYTLGKSTDVGTALPYAVLFLVLLVIAAGRYYSVDQWLTAKLGRFGFLAAGIPGRRVAIKNEQQ